MLVSQTWTVWFGVWGPCGDVTQRCSSWEQSRSSHLNMKRPSAHQRTQAQLKLGFLI